MVTVAKAVSPYLSCEDIELPLVLGSLSSTTISIFIFLVKYAILNKTIFNTWIFNTYISKVINLREMRLCDHVSMSSICSVHEVIET